jgi:regulator of RNase E activity RraA
MTVTIYSPPASSITDAELSAWAAIPVSIAVDLAPEAQIDPALRPIRPAGQQPHLIGRAVIAACETPDFGAVLHALDHVQAGDVLVIATRGIISHAMIGEILCGHLRDKGAAGLICDGAVRDVESLAGWDDFSVYSRAITPRGPDGASAGAVQCATPFGGITITPGDLIMGDDDGLIALSPARAKEILPKAVEKMAMEEHWISQLKSGIAATEVFGLEPADKI